MYRSPLGSPTRHLSSPTTFVALFLLWPRTNPMVGPSSRQSPKGGSCSMSLADLYEAAKPLPDKKCKVCVWYRQLSDADKVFFDEKAHANMSFMTRVCVENLGLDAEETTVRKHVREQHVA